MHGQAHVCTNSLIIIRLALILFLQILTIKCPFSRVIVPGGLRRTNPIVLQVIGQRLGINSNPLAILFEHRQSTFIVRPSVVSRPQPLVQSVSLGAVLAHKNLPANGLAPNRVCYSSAGQS